MRRRFFAAWRSRRNSARQPRLGGVSPAAWASAPAASGESCLIFFFGRKRRSRLVRDADEPWSGGVTGPGFLAFDGGFLDALTVNSTTSLSQASSTLWRPRRGKHDQD